MTTGHLSPPRVLGTTALIAWRAAIESLRDRMTVAMGAIFALVVPALIVLAVIRPLAAHSTAANAGSVGTVMATYLLVAGLMPSSSSVGMASGAFAGEKEQGSLAPLLASPASNGAIFAGKVLGAVAPAILFSVIADVGYVAEIALFIGADRLRLLPGALSLAMLTLVPAVAVFGAVVASLISSRVRTYNSAQQYSSLALLPVMFALFGLAFEMQTWGPWALAVGVAAVIAADVAMIMVGAATWRREEVMARR